MSALTVVLPSVQKDLFRPVNDFAGATPWLHGPARVYANDGVVLFAIVLLVGWWVARTRGREAMVAALWAPLGTLLAVAVNQPIVAAINEARPYTVLPHALTLIAHSTDPSFPSDHATMAGAVATGLVLVERRLGIVAWVLALLMAFTRVYVGAHWPLDVVAGLVLGTVVTLVGYLVFRRLIGWVVDHVARTRLRPLVAGGR
jgi:membrane-associated phospholipid phosphatase